ncbi:uncharacterized protein MONOS_18286 [Monocercomonoides exilis]|uniref:uncharacterized protein n=1 Tax=Monocercomonoides exilis TaxID=2049356 RepID=UPI00355ABA62|nr:hypothetical protein MONOS_18286 [Monocercomonoides exilis]
MLLCLTEWFSQQELIQDFNYKINYEDEAVDQMSEKEESDDEETESDECLKMSKDKKCSDIKGGGMKMEIEQQSSMEALGNPYSVLSTVPQMSSFFQFPPSFLFPAHPLPKESRSYVQVLVNCGRELINFGSSCALASICQCLASFGVQCDIKKRRGGVYIFRRLFSAIRGRTVTNKVWGTPAFMNFVQKHGGSKSDPLGITTAYEAILNDAFLEGCNIKKDFTVKQSSFKLCAKCSHVRVHNQNPSFYFTIMHPSIVKGLNLSLSATDQLSTEEPCVDAYCGCKTSFLYWTQIDRFPKILAIYHSSKENSPVMQPPKTITFHGSGSTPKSMVVTSHATNQLKHEFSFFPRIDYNFFGYVLHSMKPMPIGHFIAVVVDGRDESTGELSLLECNDGVISQVNSHFNEAYWKAMANEGWNGAICFYRINQMIE